MFDFILTALDVAEGIDFNPQGLLDMLPYLGEGMLCIFIVIGIIILITALLNKITSKKE